MHGDGKEPSRPGPRVDRMWLLLMVVSLCTVWLAVEWSWAPNCTILLGPLLMAHYGEPSGWLFFVILYPCLFAFIAKPSTPSSTISVVAFSLWLFLGKLGEGIGC